MFISKHDNRPRKISIVLACAAVLLATATWFAVPPVAYSSVYHAAPKAIAKRIMKNGINPAKFSSKARYGKKIYTARRPSTALAEKGQKSALIKMKTSKYLDKNTWDLRRPRPQLLRRYAGNTDLRGTVKKGVIGPKLGQRIGKAANAQGKAIQYRSVKNGGTNIAVPGSMLSKHPRVLYSKTVYKQ